ncbi:MAG: O-antigen ligase family protein [Pseudolabrys sp.]|nr:O-antigen ligase family protein [Pseudolabrys sp.]
MDLLIFVLFLLRSSADRVFDVMRIDLAGVEMTAGAFLNLAVLGLAGIMALTRSGRAFPFCTWLPFLLVAAASIAWSSDRTGGVRALLVLLTYASLFTIPFFLRPAARHAAELLKAIVYSSVVPVAAGLLELAVAREPGGRLQSTFVHPNGFAFYLMVVLGVIWFLRASSAIAFTPLVRKLMIPYSGVLVGLMLMTQTRAAWIGTCVIFGAYAIFVNRRYLLVAPLVPLLIFVPIVGDRLADLERGTAYTGAMESRADAINSFAWRQFMWESAFADVADTPFFGKGLASFAPNSLKFFPLADSSRTYYRGGIGAHNAYVQAYYETGAIGLLCYVAIFIGVLLRAARHFRNDRKGSVMLAAVVLAYMVINYSDNIFDYGALNLYFWGFVGTALAKWAERRPGTLLFPLRAVAPSAVGSLRRRERLSFAGRSLDPRGFNGMPRMPTGRPGGPGRPMP